MHPKAPLFVFYMPSYFKLFIFGFLKMLNWLEGGKNFLQRHGIAMGLFLWKLSSVQRCKQVNISI